MHGTTKYDDLRLKTDWQLIQLISRELDGAISCAWHALERRTPSIEAQERRAQVACSYASRLIPLIGENHCKERAGLESKLAQLRSILDALASGHDIAVLAQSLSERRGGRPDGQSEGEWERMETCHVG